MRIAWLVSIVLVCSTAAAQIATDEAAIRDLATRWEQAWNQHDMKRLFSLVTEDADFVNVGARHWKGDKDPDGTARPARGGVFTWVVVKQSSGWLIRSAQNTNLGPNNPQAPK